MSETLGAPCPTCGRPWSAEDFYRASLECRPCKRDRSHANRLVAARKIALAERLVDVLVDLAEQGWHPCGSAGTGVKAIDAARG